MAKLISLCIPTNGIIEWVFPVLDSIYRQNVSEDLFEVIVTDNGNNDEFEKKMLNLAKNHNNLIYHKTKAYSFLNEAEAYKLATGHFIKFINHRTLLKENTLNEYIDFVEKNITTKPIVYFSNGVLGKTNKIEVYNNFNLFIKNLSYWSSWSTGMGFWKEDYVKISKDVVYNELFPHTTILFSERKKSTYIIDDREMLTEIQVSSAKKGKYDLFYAFAVEYLSIIGDLLRDGDIDLETFIKVKNDNLQFIISLYFDFVIKKQECSYDLSSFEKSINVFYSLSNFKKELKKFRKRRFLKKIFK